MRISDWSSDVCSSDLRDCSRSTFRGRCDSVSRLTAQRRVTGKTLPAFGGAEPRIWRLPIPATIFRCVRKLRCCCCRSEEHTSELQSLMRISYAVLCLKKKNTNIIHNNRTDKREITN